MIEVSISGTTIPRLPRTAIASFAEDVLRAVKRDVPQSRNVSGISVRFCDDSEMKKINRSFRGINRTTDVLTFPADESFDEPGDRGHFLGDIVISVDRAKLQARDERHSLATEVKYLLLHGIIHALGFDHEADEGEMNALEVKTRKRVGLE